MGITETLKVIDAIENGSVTLLNIDWGLVGEECSDLDILEDQELLIRVGSAVIKIFACIKLGPAGAIVSLASKLLK